MRFLKKADRKNNDTLDLLMDVCFDDKGDIVPGLGRMVYTNQHGPTSGKASGGGEGKAGAACSPP